MKKIIVTIIALAIASSMGGEIYAAKKKHQGPPDLSVPLVIKWTTKLKKENPWRKRPFQLATPLIQDGTAYVGSARGILYAIDSVSGHKKWDTETQDGIYGEPTVDGDSVYVADREGIVYCMNRETGKIEWQVETGAEISAKPIVTADTVYVANTQKQIVALSKNGSGVMWVTTKIGTLPVMTIKGSSDPVLYNGKIYVGYGDGMLFCYNASDGGVVWGRQVSPKSSQFIDVDATPLIMNDIVYVPSVGGKTFALNAKDGSVVWMADKGGANSVATNGSHIFVAGNATLSSIDAATGVVAWEQKFDELEMSSPAYNNGLIFIASTKEKLYVVDAISGEIKYKRFLGKGSFGKPVVSDNTLYILTNTSNLFAMQGK